MEFLGSDRVIEIDLHQVPLNSVEFLVKPKLGNSKFEVIPYFRIILLKIAI